MTFLGTYSIYLPMHYLGFQGVPRRYFAMGDTDFMPASAQDLNAWITLSALFVAFTQILFFVNVFISLKSGKKADPNPWDATTLEWQTPDNPPKPRSPTVPKIEEPSRNTGNMYQAGHWQKGEGRQAFTG